MVGSWCEVCGTTHVDASECPGELLANDPERRGWRVNVDTPHGIEAYTVLVTETVNGVWRARIMTDPNVLWTIPGGGGAIKFAAGSPVEVERQAIEFIREHCRERGYRLRNKVALATRGLLDSAEEALHRPMPAKRVIRFLPIRFGVVNPSEAGGTGNLSSTGIFVITNHPLDVNTRLRLLLDLEREPLDLTGDVRWMNSSPRVGRSPGMGIRLHNPPTHYADYVNNLSA